MVALKTPTQKTIQSTTAHSAKANVCDIASTGSYLKKQRVTDFAEIATLI